MREAGAAHNHQMREFIGFEAEKETLFTQSLLGTHAVRRVPLAPANNVDTISPPRHQKPDGERTGCGSAPGCSAGHCERAHTDGANANDSKHDCSGEKK